MADFTYTVQIGTSADLTGADAAVRSIDRVRLATDSLTRANSVLGGSLRTTQQLADVAEARRRVSARGLSLQTGEVRNLGTVATQVGYQVTDFSVQVQSGTSALTAFAQQAPQMIGALQQLTLGAGGFAGALTSSISVGTGAALISTELALGLKLTTAAYQGMSKAIKGADNATLFFSQSMRTANERATDLQNLLRADGAKTRLDDDAAAAKRLADELKRADDIAKAQAGLDAAQAGPNAGPTGGLTAQAEQFARDLVAARAKVEAARQAYLDQTSVVSAASAPGQSAADLESAQAKLADYERQIAETSADLLALSNVADIKLRTAAIGATEEVTAKAEEAQTAVAEALKSQVDGILAEQGASASAAVQRVAAAADQILADGKVTGDETQRLVDALIQLRQDSAAGTQAAQAQVQSLIDAVRASASVAASQQTQIDEIKQRIVQLSQRN